MLVHGMGADRWRWGDVVAALAREARLVTYDRRGYGQSAVPEGYTGTTASEQGEDLAAVLDATAPDPVVLAGEDMGALACLDLLLRRPGRSCGAVLVAPPLFSLVPEATDALTAERIALGEKLHESGPRAAMQAWLGRASDVPPGSFFADYAGLASLEVTRRELRGLSVPTTILPGTESAPHVRAAARALAAALGNATLVEGDDPLPPLRELLGSA